MGSSCSTGRAPAWSSIWTGTLLPRPKIFATLHADVLARGCLSFLKCTVLTVEAITYGDREQQTYRVHIHPHFATLGARAFSSGMTITRLSVGHEVDIVENGEQAVEGVRNGIYDVVPMDVQMPVFEGIQVTLRIRVLPPPANSVTIIAVTAHAMAGAREQYLAIGVDDYAVKPIDARMLIGKLAGLPPRPDLGTAVDDGALDRPQLESLAAHLPAVSARELLAAFSDQLESQVLSIEALLAAGDLATLAREAHSLAGCSGNFGHPS